MTVLRMNVLQTFNKRRGLRPGPGVDSGVDSGTPFEVGKPIRFHPFELKIRPRGYLVTPGKNPGPKMDSDNQKMEFLMILGRDF